MERLVQMSSMGVPTSQFAKGTKMPRRNIAMVGPPMAVVKVTIICTSVPPNVMMPNAIAVETIPHTTTGKYKVIQSFSIVVERPTFKDLAHQVHKAYSMFCHY